MKSYYRFSAISFTSIILLTSSCKKSDENIIPGDRLAIITNQMQNHRMGFTVKHFYSLRWKRFTWNWGDGSRDVTEDEYAEHVYRTPGQIYKVSVEMESDAGNGKVELNVYAQ